MVSVEYLKHWNILLTRRGYFAAKIRSITRNPNS